MTDSIGTFFAAGTVEQGFESAELVYSGPPLTEREWEVLDLVAEGLSNRQVARCLGISEKTVKNHLHTIFGKLGTRSRTEAALFVCLRRRDGAPVGDLLPCGRSCTGGPHRRVGPLRVVGQ